MTATVMIVDDSLTVRMDLVATLSAAGFHVLQGATAAAARELLAEKTVDAIVLDVLLPDADGVDFLREIRATPPFANLPVLMLSSEAIVKDRVRGLRTGADDYVGKPYDRDQIVARINDLLRSRGEPGAEKQPTVLVIDDSETFRACLCEALRQAGYAVLEARDGQEGLHVAAARRPDAMLIDEMMPGLDGSTVIRKVRLDMALQGTPCILLTGLEDRDAELRALDAGADAFARKEEDLEVVLARLAAVLRNAGARTEQKASLLDPKRILAVDDSPSYLHALAASLRDEGYDMVLASSGEEAIEMLAHQKADCILLDLMMPGLNGRETCRRVKSMPRVRDVPLIMLTAVDDREAMIDALTVGADDYLPKSSDFEVLKARIRAQIRRRLFEDENRRFREELMRVELEAAEARAARTLAETKAALAEQLERKNKELEAFSYSVSHDLRAPLRTIEGFSDVLLREHSDRMDDQARDCLQRVRKAAARMSELIDELLLLSRVESAELDRQEVDLASIARQVAEELARKEPNRQVLIRIPERLIDHADRRLMRVLFENLLSNAWKFTSRTPDSQIDIGVEQQDGGRTYFVRDNGAGFDMAKAQRLFTPFCRLHSEAEYPGTGIGLATVRRIVDRHGGGIWATGQRGYGSTFYFRLAQPQSLQAAARRDESVPSEAAAGEV